VNISNLISYIILDAYHCAKSAHAHLAKRLLIKRFHSVAIYRRFSVQTIKFINAKADVQRF
jgi:hypothetical protein